MELWEPPRSGNLTGATELKKPRQPGIFKGDARAGGASTFRDKNHRWTGDLTNLHPHRESRERRLAENRDLSGAKPSLRSAGMSERSIRSDQNTQRLKRNETEKHQRRRYALRRATGRWCFPSRDSLFSLFSFLIFTGDTHVSLYLFI